MQGYLSTHALDRNNMGLCFETYWDAVSKGIILIQGDLGTGDKIIHFKYFHIHVMLHLFLQTMRSEFIEETVIRPLTLLFGSLPKVWP